MPYYSKILKYAHTHTHTPPHQHTQQPLCTHFTLYTHMHTLIKGVLNQGHGEPPMYTLATSSPIPTHACTHNKHYHRNGFPQAPVSHQSVTASQLLEHLHAILQQNIEVCTHTHTTATMHTLHTLYSHAYTNHGGTEPGAEPPMYTLATCSPTLTHTHTHTCTHSKHYYSNGPRLSQPPSSRSWSPPISTVREEKQLSYVV